MFKIHLGNTPHQLTPDQFKKLGEMTEGYSGADIAIIVRDAMMQPVRAVQTATHFKRVSGPDRNDPTQIVHDYLTPCSPGDPDAIEMSWIDVEGSKLKEPEVTFADFLKSLKSQKPSVSAEDIKQHIKFTNDFGQEVLELFFACSNLFCRVKSLFCSSVYITCLVARRLFMGVNQQSWTLSLCYSSSSKGMILCKKV